MDFGLYQSIKKRVVFYGVIAVDISDLYQKVSIDFPGFSVDLSLKRRCTIRIRLLNHL